MGETVELDIGWVPPSVDFGANLGNNGRTIRKVGALKKEAFEWKHQDQQLNP